ITRKEPVMNIAARAARWSAAHWKTATFGWLALALAAVVAGTVVGTQKLTDTESATGDSARAQQILERAGIRDRATESVLVQSKSSTVDDARFRRTVGTVVTALKARHDVIDVRSPLAGGNAVQISKDRHSALVQFDLKGDAQTAGDRVKPVLDEVRWLQRKPFSL